MRFLLSPYKDIVIITLHSIAENKTTHLHTSRNLITYDGLLGVINS